MNSTETNLKLIENITVQVPNTTSISKEILFNVSKFLEKMVFQLMFEIIKWIRQHQVRPQTVPNCSKIFLTRKCYSTLFNKSVELSARVPASVTICACTSLSLSLSASHSICLSICLSISINQCTYLSSYLNSVFQSISMKLSFWTLGGNLIL